MSEIRSGWSNLSPDILRSILEVLSTQDFHRARTVCSNWYSVSRTFTRPLYPWRVVFDKHSTFVHDPGENKTRKIDHPGLNLSNPNHGERISFTSMDVVSLLPVEAIWECFKELTNKNNVSSRNSASCLWINERTRDYVVAWSK
ncbi:unnamed protein product [Microthlaspi erraticum]|uniref:F-box domain-containing protein n=1 Tax=Microthlaspi erraticum TaxID=1685480 RepID=A0A6D2KCY5_9BRAS|nr:unnamed protein product [Microthlaspi erraticum]